MQDFRDLKVWQKGHELTLGVYRPTAQFPRDGLYGLTSQMRRSAVSAPANVAEGCCRGADPEFARFLRIAMGAASELEYHCLLARDLELLRATVDGQVTELLAHAADRVQPGSRLVTIFPTSADRVVAYLPQQRGLAAKVGASVQVSCLAMEDSRRREYSGTLVSLSATISEAPLPYRRMPAYPAWGRGMLIALDKDVDLIPGEAVQIALSDCVNLPQGDDRPQALAPLGRLNARLRTDESECTGMN